MLFKHIYEEGLAQGSYFIGCQSQGTAIVVDPRRDIQVYLEEARKNGMKIAAVAETHIHADYLSGAREAGQGHRGPALPERRGRRKLEVQGPEGFDYQLVRDGDQIKLGNITLTVVHTPGHTPEHISFLVQDGAAASKPGFFLTGDFVFVGDVGRPDLLEEAAGIKGTAEPGARRMFKSLKEKFLTLPDYVQVWPGHGAGSACGKGLGAVASTTVGYERRFAWWADYLQKGDEEGFVKALLSGQPEAPYYFAQMKRLNRDGMPILGQLPQPQLLTPEQFQRRLSEGALLVDTRDKLAFAGGHLRGAINIPGVRASAPGPAGCCLMSATSSCWPAPSRSASGSGSSSASGWIGWWGTSPASRATHRVSWRPFLRSARPRPKPCGKRARPPSWTCAGPTST